MGGEFGSLSYQAVWMEVWFGGCKMVGLVGARLWGEAKQERVRADRSIVEVGV